MPNRVIINKRDEIKIAVLEVQMSNINRNVEALSTKIDDLTKKLDDNYVRKEDFLPVKGEVDKLRYWQAKVIGMSAGAAALVDLVLRYFSRGQL